MPGAAVRTGTSTPLPSISLRGHAASSNTPRPCRDQGEHNQNPWRGAGHGQHTRTSQRGSRRWDGRAAPALTEDSEAAENLGVVFNSQGHERVGRSTDLWEKKPCQGRHRAGCRPVLGTGMSRGGCGNTPRHRSAARSSPRAERQLGCAQRGPSPPERCLGTRCPLLFKGVPLPSWPLPLQLLQKEPTCLGAIKAPQAPSAARPAHVCLLWSAKRTLRAAAEPKMLC